MSGVEYPKIHLVMDNCFAVKRWVRPCDWMKAIQEIGGIRLIQASTDNEIDPVHNTQDFRDEWIEEVRLFEREFGFKVVSFYSGYAQYRTVGIASHSKSKRNAMIELYFKPTVDVAAQFGAQVGNTLGAFSEPVLEDPKEFSRAYKHVEDCLVQMTKYAHEKNVLFGYEQMYTPTQGMWTIQGCSEFMRRVSKRANAPMYVTIDTAHQAGQHMFLKPSVAEIEAMQSSRNARMSYLPVEVQERIVRKEDATQIYNMLDQYDYWFADPGDNDVYQWLSRLGCYSPIVHLQQTDGTYSSHKPFTAQYNKDGIIKPREVFAAIKKSYDREEEAGMPPRVQDIYLAFEVFFNVMDATDKIIGDLRESVEYWRKALPRDGMRLDELV